MAKAESCHNCVYSRWDRNLAMWTMGVGMPVRPTCANQPDFPGRWKECPLGRICKNFRVRPPVPKGETVKTISLGDGFEAYVDATDFEWLNQWTWRLCGRYAGRMENGKLIFMHREIMQSPEGMIVDHKNRNRLDNTRDNLRPFTHAENARNRPKARGTTSQFRGVSHDKKADKYQAQIHYKGRSRYIGYFTDEIEAARAYDYKAVELFGDEARLNFPEEWPPERRAAVAAAAGGRKTEDRGRRKERTPRTEDRRRKAGKAKNKKARAETQGRRDQQRKTKPERVTGHRSQVTRHSPQGKRNE